MKQKPLLLLTSLGLLTLLLMGCAQAAGSRGWAQPVDSDDYLLVSTGKGRLDGLQGSDNKRAWRFPNDWEIPESAARKLKGIYGPPVTSSNGNVIFVGDYNNHVYAFRPRDLVSATEKPKAASVDLRGHVIGGIALDSSGDTLYATAGRQLLQIDASELIDRIANRDASVRVAILFEAAEDIWSAPILDGNRIYFASLDGNVYAIDRNGGTVWTYAAGHPVTTLTLSPQTLYAGGFDSSLVALDSLTGNAKWQAEATNWVWSRVFVDSDNLYFGDFSGVLFSVSARDGSERWQLDLGHGTIRGGPVLARGTIVVGTDDGWLIGVDTSGSKRWETKVDSALRADLAIADNGDVIIAPSGCVTPQDSSEKAYFISVDPATGELERASGVC